MQFRGVNEGDEGRIAATTEAAKLLNCILPSDLKMIRGQVRTCDRLMEAQIGSTNGVVLPFENGRGDQAEGESECFRSQLHNALSWLRGIYQKFWDNDAKELMAVVGRGPLGQEKRYEQVKSCIEKRRNLHEYASNLSLFQYESLSWIPV